MIRATNKETAAEQVSINGDSLVIAGVAVPFDTVIENGEVMTRDYSGKKLRDDLRRAFERFLDERDCAR